MSSDDESDSYDSEDEDEYDAQLESPFYCNRYSARGGCVCGKRDKKFLDPCSACRADPWRAAICNAVKDADVREMLGKDSFFVKTS